MAEHARMRIPVGLAAFARAAILPGSSAPLFYYDAGPADAPVLLLIHGLGDEADTWRSVIGPLGETNRVIAPDLPGFGRSALPPRWLMTPPFLCRVLKELMASLGIAGATLVGSSLGASLGQLLALREPQLATGLVLVDGGLLAITRLPPALLAMLVPVVGERRYRSLENDLDAAYASLQPYYAELDKLPADDRAFLRKRVEDRVASATQRKAYFALFRGYFGWMLLKGRGARRRAALLDIPTAYVWGAEDRIVPVKVGEAARGRHAAARLEVVSGAGHLPHQEAPAEFLRILRAALRIAAVIVR